MTRWHRRVIEQVLASRSPRVYEDMLERLNTDLRVAIQEGIDNAGSKDAVLYNCHNFVIIRKMINNDRIMGRNKAFSSVLIGMECRRPKAVRFELVICIAGSSGLFDC